MSQAQALGTKVCVSCGQRFPSDGLFCPNDGSPLQSASSADRTEASDPYLGRELSGHIEIRQLIGIGAMGRVYRAFQRGVDRDVAVKILHRELSANAQLVTRFTREAKVASRLQHPNVVHVILAGQLPDGALYMVMEYLDGLSLQSALAAAGGAMDLPRALHVTLQLCEAVGEAHAQGIVHRDLKPENVMLVRRGNDDDFVKVLDFGIARINWGEQSMSTAAGLIFGTARYISPEGAQGQTVRPESDVYSIATLVFQMLAGRTPFEGDQAVALLVAQTHDTPPPLRSIPRSEYVPQPLADVIMANLAKDADKRASDARALGHAILDAAQDSGLSTDDISRPLHRRTPSVVKLPPLQRTRQHELSPELAARIGAPSAASPGSHDAGKRAPTEATVKWSPPTDFASRLSPEPSHAAPAAAPVRARPKGVDRTLDDVDAPAPPSPSSPSLAGNTEYAEPEERAAPEPEPPPRRRTPSGPIERESRPTLQSHADADAEEEERPSAGRSRTVMLVVLCFVIGVTIAMGIAWRSGRIGGESELERTVALATDAMFQNRFAEPPGNNVRDITTAGLKRWPGDRRLLDVRARAANELVSQAISQRAAGEIAEALKLVRLAVELDPNDPSAKRLADQYEIDLAAAPAPGPAPKLPTPKPIVTAPSPGKFKVQLEVSSTQARLGQPVALTARLTPARGPFRDAVFSIKGPGATEGLALATEAGAAGVFKAGHAFTKAGRFEVSFTAKADGKEVRAARPISVVEVKVAPPPGTAVHPPATALPTAPPTAPTAPAPTGSVKWM